MDHTTKGKQSKISQAIGLVGMLLVILAVGSCKKNRPPNIDHGFPEDVAELLRENCATSGCHEPTSFEGAGGLNLNTWDDLFTGARGGSPVVPYNPEASYLLQALNTDTNWLPQLLPTMPLGGEAYTPLELQVIIDWINDGAPNANGEEPFPPQADRTKWYVANRRCDEIGVFDAASGQVMRVIPIGNDGGAIEEPMNVVLSPDQQRLYVSFLYWNPHIEVYNTLTDEPVMDIELDRHGYSHLAISPDGNFLFAVSQWQKLLSVVNLNTGLRADGPISLPENSAGLAVHPNRSTIYYGSTESEHINLWDYNSNGELSNYRTVDLVQHIPAPANLPYPIEPVDIEFLSDGSKYFVSCYATHEIRVFDGNNDSLLNVIPTAGFPDQIAISEVSQQLYISCELETDMHGGDPLKKGAVSILDYASNTHIKDLYTGFQPHGIDVDESSGYVVVAHRNLDPGAPPSHHGSKCEGRNGNIVLIDKNTLEVVPDYKPELSVDPFALVVKD